MAHLQQKNGLLQVQGQIRAKGIAVHKVSYGPDSFVHSIPMQKHGIGSFLCGLVMVQKGFQCVEKLWPSIAFLFPEIADDRIAEIQLFVCRITPE